jgi:hypothetical protein
VAGLAGYMWRLGRLHLRAIWGKERGVRLWGSRRDVTEHGGQVPLRQVKGVLRLCLDGGHAPVLSVCESEICAEQKSQDGDPAGYAKRLTHRSELNKR